MFIICIRTIILYSLVVFTMRLMGKRQIGELQPYEFVITIMISDLASLPMQDVRLPLLQGIVPIITLLFIKTIITQLELRIQKSREVLDGSPCILIYKGKINYKVLKKQQLNIDELFEELRLSKYFNLDEVEYAILENSGQLSILPRDYNRDISPTHDKSDIDIDVQLPKLLICDGKINKSTLTSLNKDKNWILSLLSKYDISSIQHVLLALYDTKGEFKFQLYDEYEKTRRKNN